MMNGIGIHGVYPLLAGSDSLANNKARLIKLILESVQGSTVVKGVECNGEIQSISLTDQQVFRFIELHPKFLGAQC